MFTSRKVYESRFKLIITIAGLTLSRHWGLKNRRENKRKPAHATAYRHLQVLPHTLPPTPKASWTASEGSQTCSLSVCFYRWAPIIPSWALHIPDGSSLGSSFPVSLFLLQRGPSPVISRLKIFQNLELSTEELNSSSHPAKFCPQFCFINSVQYFLFYWANT